MLLGPYDHFYEENEIEIRGRPARENRDRGYRGIQCSIRAATSYLNRRREHYVPRSATGR